jgi:hypothetical protein
MENEFIPYKQALALKELGFEESCFGYYDGNHNLQFMYNGIPENFTNKRMGPADSVWVGWISAPLYQQAFRWFSKKHDMDSFIERDRWNDYRWYQILIQKDPGLSKKWIPDVDNDDEICYKTQGGAELECLKKLIELLIERNDS